MSVSLANGATLTVEIGFATTSGDGLVPIGGLMSDIVWTDVTEYVRGELQWERGRSTELDDFQTGSCTLVLENSDRRFDPDYASGPYYGKLTPGRPLRISLAAGDIYIKRMFMGFVDTWMPEYSDPAEGRCTVFASDPFKVLNALTLPSIFESLASGYSPDVWFRFDDGDAPTVAFDNATQTDLGNWITTGASTSGLIADDPSTAASFDGSNYISFPIEKFPFNHSNYLEWTVSFWVQTTETEVGNYGIFCMGSQETTIQFGMKVATVAGENVGTISAVIGTIAGIAQMYEFDSSVVVNDGNPHHVSFRWEWNTPITHLIVDGVVQSSYTSDYGYQAGPPDIRIGSGWSFFSSGNFNFPLNYTGTIDEFLIFTDTCLTATQIQNLRSAGRGTYGAGQRTDQRADGVLDIAGWPADGRIFSVGKSTVAGYAIHGQSVLNAIKDCEAAEAGMMFCGGDGDVVFMTRTDYGSTTTYTDSQFTFGDSTGEILFEQLQFQYDDQFLFNSAIVSQRNGVTAVANDASSQDKFFKRTISKTDLIVQSAEFCNDYADALVAQYKDPHSRIESMSVLANRSRLDVIETVIACDLGYRVTVNRRPLNSDVISREVIIEGVKFNLNSDEMLVTFKLSTVGLDWFVLDHSDLGVLDQNALGF